MRPIPTQKVRFGVLSEADSLARWRRQTRLLIPLNIGGDPDQDLDQGISSARRDNHLLMAPNPEAAKHSGSTATLRGRHQTSAVEPTFQEFGEHLLMCVFASTHSSASPSDLSKERFGVSLPVTPDLLAVAAATPFPIMPQSAFGLRLKGCHADIMAVGAKLWSQSFLLFGFGINAGFSPPSILSRYRRRSALPAKARVTSSALRRFGSLSSALSVSDPVSLSAGTARAIRAFAPLRLQTTPGKRQYSVGAKGGGSSVLSPPPRVSSSSSSSHAGGDACVSVKF